ncbi:hypothetical protein Syun_023289 [Stephania yunnanensis]|uniref:Uncharacterized protein n=1 Tax=Stephania yunnanensis TaxID=152371 RepID=A0AAP0HZG2_9MAGN
MPLHLQNHHLRPPSLRLASDCSSSHFAFGLFLARLRLLVVAFLACRRHRARPLALPFASPALLVVHSLAFARPLPEGEFFNQKGYPRNPFPNSWKGKKGLYSVGFTGRGLSTTKGEGGRKQESGRQGGQVRRMGEREGARSDDEQRMRRRAVGGEQERDRMRNAMTSSRRRGAMTEDEDDGGFWRCSGMKNMYAMSHPKTRVCLALSRLYDPDPVAPAFDGLGLLGHLFVVSFDLQLSKGQMLTLEDLLGGYLSDPPLHTFIGF